MHSKLRWSPIVYTQGEDGMLVYKQQSFSEVVVLNVVKKSISERCIHNFILFAYDLCLLNY